MPVAAPTNTIVPFESQSFERKERAPVSVIVPCYRCADTIAASVASIAAQSLPPQEVLLVDDCSGDGTVQALRAVAAAYPSGWV
ncbi:MAG TPA: glycosyltransferase, partial [Lysobacter sp.]